jgi:hypothetical protein
MLLAALLLSACTPSSSLADFTGGNFQFTTQSVTDGCLDGAMDVLFMPEGASTPNDFANPIYIPALSELPDTYTVSLQDPFSDMQVTVTGDESTRTVTGAQNDDVEFDATNHPGCLVNDSIDVALVIDSVDDLHGTATLHTSSFDESSCPVPTADPCTVTLDLTGARVQ